MVTVVDSVTGAYVADGARVWIEVGSITDTLDLTFGGVDLIQGYPGFHSADPPVTSRFTSNTRNTPTGYDRTSTYRATAAASSRRRSRRDSSPTNDSRYNSLPLT